MKMSLGLKAACMALALQMGVSHAYAAGDPPKLKKTHGHLLDSLLINTKTKATTAYILSQHGSADPDGSYVYIATNKHACDFMNATSKAVAGAKAGEVIETTTWAGVCDRGTRSERYVAASMSLHAKFSKTDKFKTDIYTVDSVTYRVSDMKGNVIENQPSAPFTGRFFSK